MIREREERAFSRALSLILAAGFALVATAASAHNPTAPTPTGSDQESLAEIRSGGTSPGRAAV